MKYIKHFLSAVLLMTMVVTLPTTASALEQGAYGVYAGSNYWNPDTGEIDDGGTANAALGDGMSRSVTGTTALVEREGDSYYVTIRLLLQSSTYDAQFWTRTGYNSYEAVSYDIMAENAVADSVDYRFAVDDPFQPIKASMYVVPMGRETTWYIELDERTAVSDTEDFIISVQTAVVEELEEVRTEAEEELAEEETLMEEAVLEETIIQEEDEIQEELQIEEESQPEERQEETAIQEPVEEPVEETIFDGPQEEEQAEYFSLIVVGAGLAVAAIAAVVVMRKRGKRG